MKRLEMPARYTLIMKDSVYLALLKRCGEEGVTPGRFLNDLIEEKVRTLSESAEKKAEEGAPEEQRCEPRVFKVQDGWAYEKTKDGGWVPIGPAKV